MSLTYLSGVGAVKRKAAAPKPTAVPKSNPIFKAFTPAKKAAAPTAAPKAKILQKTVNKTPTAKLIKAVAKQSNLTAQKIQKNRAQTQQRRAFKKANEAAIIKQNDLEAQEAFNLPPIKADVDNETYELEAPDMSAEESAEDFFDEGEDMGIIYPEFSGARKVKKAKKASTKSAAKTAKATGKQQRKNTKAATKANKGTAKNAKKTARAADTAARGERRGALLKQGLDTASVILKKKFGVEGGGEQTTQDGPMPQAPNTKPSFLESIPTPVKIGGGIAAAFLLYKAIK